MKSKRILIVVNEDRFFLSHRKEVAIAAQEAGWDVVLVAKNTGCREYVESLGIKFIELPVNPTGKKLHQEFKTFRYLYSLYGKERKNDVIVHHVGLKSIVWGGLAARLRKIKGIVNAISGLGIIFSDFNPSRIKHILVPIMRWSMHADNVTLIFQNKEDKKLFADLGISSHARVKFLKGSGVNLTEFKGNAHSPEGSPLRVIFAGRMVKDKGVKDLIEAAEILRPKYQGKVEFVLCGSLTSNSHAVTEEELNILCDGEYIRYLGYCKDIAVQMERSDIMCFPSYYREGVPKALLDASAAGLPIITCDTVGCKDTVIEGVNGFMVDPQSPQQVAEKLDILLSEEGLRRRMGQESRKIAEREYDVKKIADSHIEIYNEMFNSIYKN